MTRRLRGPAVFLWSLAGAGTALGLAPRAQVIASSGALTVEALSDTLFHCELGSADQAPNGAIPATVMVARHEYPSPKASPLGAAALETDAVRVVVDTRTLCASFFDKRRQAPVTTICPLRRENRPAGLNIDPAGAQDAYGLGEKFLVPGEPNGNWFTRVRASKNPFGNALLPFEGGFVGNAQFPVLYALGEGRQSFAVFVDSTRKQIWNLGADPWFVLDGDWPLRFYVIAGDGLPALRAQYMDLVGRPPVPPKKAFGLWVSEYGYMDWAEMEDKLRTLRQNQFPIDGFVLDVTWYGPFKQNGPNFFGRMDWDLKHFPTPRTKLVELRQRQAIGIALAEDPYVNTDQPEFSELSARGFLVKSTDTGQAAVLKDWWGEAGMLDWTNDEAAAYWHDWKRQPLIDAGALIHWTDLAEPETYTSAAIYHGTPGVNGVGELDVHNAYALLWQRSIYEGYARHKVLRRPFILARSGTSGSQRYGVALWSGDIGSNLRSLAAHANAQLQLSLSGLDYFGSDVGGFHREGLQGDLNETYTRWFAHSAAYDVLLRPHTDNGSKQRQTAPDRIGDLPSNLFNARLRYSLIPYYYTLAHRAAERGEPVFPPLVYHYQDDRNVRTIGDEKLIGRDLLVATALKAAETSRAVYLPAGRWIDYHTGLSYDSAGQWLSAIPEYQGQIFRLPLFARAGAILPKMKVDSLTMDAAGRRLDGTRADELYVRVYPSTAPTSFELVEDDGETTDYLKGRLRRTTISQRRRGDLVAIELGAARGSYDGAPAARASLVELYVGPSDVGRAACDGRELAALGSEAALARALSGWAPLGSGLILAKAPLEPVDRARRCEFWLKAD